MTKNLPSFQQYQMAFTAHLRDPKRQAKPKNVVAKGMNVYKEIVFNNIFESVSACFPVAQKVIGKRAWQKLVRDFFREHSANTPIFRKIPEEFLSYLSTTHTLTERNLPPYLASLCHYEWVELLVSTMPDARQHPEIENTFKSISIFQDGFNLDSKLAFTPAMQLLHYDYAVQKISSRNNPNEKEATHLLVYRSATFAIKFIEINAVTYKLVALLQQEHMVVKQALQIMTSELSQVPEKNIIEFGVQILSNLQEQGVIIGVYD